MNLSFLHKSKHTSKRSITIIKHKSKHTSQFLSQKQTLSQFLKHTSRTERASGSREPANESKKRSGVVVLPKENSSRGKKNPDSEKNKEFAKAERDRKRRNNLKESSFKSMDAWKQKRNWEDILTSQYASSSRFSYSPGMSRKSTEPARILHYKLMSRDKKKKTSLDLKKEAEEKHARAMRIM